MNKKQTRKNYLEILDNVLHIKNVDVTNSSFNEIAYFTIYIINGDISFRISNSYDFFSCTVYVKGHEFWIFRYSSLGRRIFKIVQDLINKRVSNQLEESRQVMIDFYKRRLKELD